MSARDPGRRDVILGGAAALGLAAATWPWRPGLAATAPMAPARARVGMARDVSVLDAQDRVAPEGVSKLLGRSLAAALAVPDAVAGLRRLFLPTDVVGIKVNCLAGRGLSTHEELVQELCRLLVEAGVAANNIVVWDRSDGDLQRARYTVRRTGPGPLCYGTNGDYEREPIDAGSVGGCLSRIVTQRVTAIINVPVLKSHDISGISGALKNFYGAIHNPNKYHDNGCSPFIADLAVHPQIRGKVRLTVFDALRPQCHGGPAYVPAYTWKLGALFASTDPVAADAVALRLIEARRRETGLESLAKAGKSPRWLHQAAVMGLGIDEGRRIDEVQG